MAYTEDFKEEVLDQTPVAIPLGFKKPEPMHEMLNRLINNRFRDLELQGEETFEEADDFDVDDDYDPNSPWEEVFDPHTGENLGFLDQNRYQMPRLYERRLDEREQSYSVDKNRDCTHGSVQGDSVGSNSQRSE